MYLGGRENHLLLLWDGHVEMLSVVCPCSCLLESLSHLLDPRVLPSSLPVPTCLCCRAAFQNFLCLMHILLELPENLYPPGDTSMQVCSLQLPWTSVRDIWRVVLLVYPLGFPLSSDVTFLPWPLFMLGSTSLLPDWFS